MWGRRGIPGYRHLGSWLEETTRESIPSDESPARDDVLPARGRRRRAAPAEVRDPPAELRHRDARARPGRPEVGAPRRGGYAADARRCYLCSLILPTGEESYVRPVS